MKSEQLKKKRFKRWLGVRKKRRHGDTEALRLRRPTEHQDTETRKQSGIQPKNHGVNRAMRRRKNGGEEPRV